MRLLALTMALIAIFGSPQTKAPVDVPLHEVNGPPTERRLGIDLTVGTDRVRLLVDTYSPGLWVVARWLRDGSATRTGNPAEMTFGSPGIRLRGKEALASLSIASAGGTGIPIEVVDHYSWDRGKTKMPKEFGDRFLPGMLGLSMTKTQPSRGCCANPLPALANGIGKRYILHARFDKPLLILDPDEATRQKFTMVDVGDDGLPHGCVTIDAMLPHDFCGEVFFDSEAWDTTIDGRFDSRTVPSGSAFRLRFGNWQHDFVPTMHVRFIWRRDSVNRITIGLMGLQQLDVLFDFNARKIGVRSI